MDTHQKMKTTVLPVDVRKIGKLTAAPSEGDILDEINIQLDEDASDAANLRLAAEKLKRSDIPVAFPTETVYGLGADATRSAAVNGIYEAKQRPADNPLIVHFASLDQLRNLLRPSQHSKQSRMNGHIANGDIGDPIPEIYKPLISRFWPGPLTIILPNPSNSQLAPEVTAGLNTFGARLPRHILALALIKLANVPIAAPSANASTKPSPTAAEHVAYDLDGSIETIIDGGPCDVGVESTVVDGLSNPPLILRPGGISLEQIRSCPGWNDTQIGYKNVSETGNQPKAPGMKYRHYSPRAPVVLFEPGKHALSLSEVCDFIGTNRKVGVITTKQWQIRPEGVTNIIQQRDEYQNGVEMQQTEKCGHGFAGMLQSLQSEPSTKQLLKAHSIEANGSSFRLLEIALGYQTADIARGVFSALRELDREGVDAILVEGINDEEGDTAAAVMNRLRKAAEIEVGK